MNVREKEHVNLTWGSNRSARKLVHTMCKQSSGHVSGIGKRTGYTTLKKCRGKKPLFPPQYPSYTAAQNWNCKMAFFFFKKSEDVQNNAAIVEESFKCHKPEQEGFRPYKNVGLALALRAIFEELTFHHLQESQIHNPNPSTHLMYTMMASSKKTGYHTVGKSILWALWASLRSCYPAGVSAWSATVCLGCGLLALRWDVELWSLGKDWLTPPQPTLPNKAHGTRLKKVKNKTENNELNQANSKYLPTFVNRGSGFTWSNP